MLQNFTFASIEKAPAAGLDFLLLSEEFSGSADRRGENQRPSSLTAGLMTDGSCGNCGTLPFASSCSRKAGKAGMEAHFIEIRRGNLCHLDRGGSAVLLSKFG